MNTGHRSLAIRPGLRLHSVVCDTQVVVVRAADPAVDLRCGGQPMATEPPAGSTGGLVDASPGAGTDLGKRYVDEAAGLEVLCTRAGAGRLTVGTSPLRTPAAKPLPSSD